MSRYRPRASRSCPVSIETGGAHQIFEAQRPIAAILRRQPNVTLALVRRVVDGHKPAVDSRARPEPGDETVRRPVAIPGGRAFEQPPVAVANGRIAEQRQQPVIEPLQLAIGRFDRRADEVRRNALAAAFELTLVEEPQPGRQIGDDGSRLVHRPA